MGKQKRTALDGEKYQELLDRAGFSQTNWGRLVGKDSSVIRKRKAGKIGISYEEAMLLTLLARHPALRAEVQEIGADLADEALDRLEALDDG